MGPVRAVRVLGWTILGQLVLLAGSGIYLCFEYRPSSAGATGVAAAVRAVHRLDARLLIASAAALVILLLVERTARRSGLPGAVAVATLGLIASFTGYLLPWDQLAIWAVRVGTNLSGYGPMFSDDVRFVVVGGAEISPSTVIRWLVVHAATSLLATGCCLAMVMTRWRRAGAVTAPSEPVRMPRSQ